MQYSPRIGSVKPEILLVFGVSPIAVRAEIITEENDILKIEVPRSRAIVSTLLGEILRRRLKMDGTPEVVPMYSYELPSRLSELGLLEFSAQPFPGATLKDLDPNQRERLSQNYTEQTRRRKDIAGID